MSRRGAREVALHKLDPLLDLDTVKPWATRRAAVWKKDVTFRNVAAGFMKIRKWVERCRGVWKYRERITLLEGRVALATIKHALRNLSGRS